MHFITNKKKKLHVLKTKSIACRTFVSNSINLEMNLVEYILFRHTGSSFKPSIVV